jgi:hypothetical protein
MSKVILIVALLLSFFQLQAKSICRGLIGCDGDNCFEFKVQKRSKNYILLKSTGAICRYTYNKGSGYRSIKVDSTSKRVSIKITKSCKASSNIYGDGNYKIEDGIGTTINLDRAVFKFPKQIIMIDSEDGSCFNY